jgi:hypothetical protein
MIGNTEKALPACAKKFFLLHEEKYDEEFQEIKLQLPATFSR